MDTLHPGRYTAAIEGPFVVFLIGFRVNRLLAVRKWLPVAKAMGPMLKELHANPSLGFLAAHSSLYWRGVMVTQYWRSFDHLVAYAQSRDSIHLPAWKAFNQRVGSDGTVGIWHETYQVAKGNYESVYVNSTLPATTSSPQVKLNVWLTPETVGCAVDVCSDCDSTTT